MSKQRKTITHKTVRFEPGRVIFMIAVVSVLTLVFVAVLATL